MSIYEVPLPQGPNLPALNTPYSKETLLLNKKRPSECYALAGKSQESHHYLAIPPKPPLIPPEPPDR